MRQFFLVSLSVAALCGRGVAADTTALEALKLLPKEHRARMARIEARDGSPAPERWHILVHDPAVKNGLKEFVVAGGAIVAERGVSQFAENITPEQIIGDAVKFDSPRAALLLKQYALANNGTVGTVAYQLRKDGPTAVPLWRLTCFDPIGRELGSLTITATKGSVISNQGFPNEPAPAVAEKPREKPRTSATAQVAREVPSQPAQPAAPPATTQKPNLIRRLFGGERQAQ